MFFVNYTKIRDVVFYINKNVSFYYHNFFVTMCTCKPFDRWKLEESIT